MDFVIVLVLLPHHGSRRNSSSNWIKKFNLQIFVVSAIDDARHPENRYLIAFKIYRLQSV